MYSLWALAIYFSPFKLWKLWAAISYIMTAKGSDYLLYLSIGGSLFIFLRFLSDAVCLTQTTIVSQILGSKKYLLLQSDFKSGITLVSLMIIITSIPLLIYPISVFHFLFPKIVLNPSLIRTLFSGVWLSFVFVVTSSVPIGYIRAFKDMNFSVGMGFFNWINGFLLIYLTIQIFHAKAVYFQLDAFYKSYSLLAADEEKYSSSSFRRMIFTKDHHKN